MLRKTATSYRDSAYEIRLEDSIACVVIFRAPSLIYGSAECEGESTAIALSISDALSYAYYGISIPFSRNYYLTNEGTIIFENKEA